MSPLPQRQSATNRDADSTVQRHAAAGSAVAATSYNLPTSTKDYTNHPAPHHPLALQVSAWQQHTTAALQEVWLEGLGHNYIADAPDSLLQSIASQLS